MEFNRIAENQLLIWKNSDSRKPLVIRGARQVGKTTLVKKFSKTYKHQILLNLEKSSDVRFFKQTDNVNIILETLFLAYKLPGSEIAETLIFIDEIQECPEAIGLLRYFYEEIPNIHIIAAGSLLEFAIKDVKSFPVGRVDFLYMFPLNFMEYLEAVGHQPALEQLNRVPILPFAQTVILEQFNRYAITGGMPEIIARLCQTENLADLPQIYESLRETYINDIKKYANNDTERRVITHIIKTAHLYLDQRIKFHNFGNSNYRSREVGEAMRHLEDAGLIQLIYPVVEFDIPVKPALSKSPRIQFLDTGLINYALGIQSEMLTINDLSNIYKGAVIPHLITQELISLFSQVAFKPNFWVREKNQATSEVDLIYVYKNKVIPIEIKSGKTGTLKSLHQFIDISPHHYAVRIYSGSFIIEKTRTPTGKPYLLMNLPYFLGTKLPEYIAYFVENNGNV